MMFKNNTNPKFSNRKILDNESGMILLIAATFIMIISIVMIGLINRNVTQILSAHQQYKKIQAEQLARGAWWIAHDSLLRGAGFPASPPPITNNNVTYTITFIDDGIVAGRQQYRVRVTY